MTEVTDEARIAAEKAFARQMKAGTHTLADCLNAALAAAAPLIVSHRETATAAAIAKAERERIRQLAIESDAKYVFRIDFPDNELRPFADLLTEG